jgi:hypothetical protein
MRGQSRLLNPLYRREHDEASFAFVVKLPEKEKKNPQREGNLLSAQLAIQNLFSSFSFYETCPTNNILIFLSIRKEKKVLEPRGIDPLTS